VISFPAQALSTVNPSIRKNAFIRFMVFPFFDRALARSTVLMLLGNCGETNVSTGTSFGHCAFGQTLGLCAGCESLEHRGVFPAVSSQIRALTAAIGQNETANAAIFP
jgi:hypothetical protein